MRDVPRTVSFWTQALVSPDAAGPQLALTQVSSDAQRHHLNLYAQTQQAEVSRLPGLGASRVDWLYPEEHDFVVLSEPDDNRFCVVKKG